MNRSKTWETLRPYAMILPAMVAILCFVIYPVFQLLRLSFYKYNLLNKAKSKFVGVDNYEQLFAKEEFYTALTNTVVYTIATVILTMLIALLLALWINQTKGRKMNALLQAGIFTPHIISIVSIALVWMLLMEPNHGILNYLLKLAGLPPSKWLQSSSTSMISVILVSIWHNVGYYALIILAALKSVPLTIYEAAALDNASRLKTFFKITLPMISPQLFFILIIMTIGSFKVFDTVRIMTGGGPNNSTSTLVYHIYEYRSNNLGYASATGIVLMAIIAILTFIYFRMLSKKVHYQ